MMSASTEARRREITVSMDTSGEAVVQRSSHFYAFPVAVAALLYHSHSIAMRLSLLTLLTLFLSWPAAAEPDFPLTEDSKPQPSVPKGELLKGSHTAKEGSVFPGTEREYTLYLPHGFDKAKAAPFMVFQDGVIYQAPVVFDNLIAKKEMPPLVGIFVKPGVVPAANENALPRYNRSYEYDSVTDMYARFVTEELLPAIEEKHDIKLSTDPNDAAISGNSSGGIAAFMVAWHRPDRFRRVFTGVGTYVGIHGADQLPVLVRKFEPKPIKVFLQSGTGDNNLYCGDWWMANLMMERSLTWAGYEVNHAWGEGGHNQKHASQIFPEVMRWLWKGWPEAKEVKANPRGESKWKGYEVVDTGEWELVKDDCTRATGLAANRQGDVVWCEETASGDAVLMRLKAGAAPQSWVKFSTFHLHDFAFGKDDCLYVLCDVKATKDTVFKLNSDGQRQDVEFTSKDTLAVAFDSVLSLAGSGGTVRPWPAGLHVPGLHQYGGEITLSPDQTTVYQADAGATIKAWQYREDGSLHHRQDYCELQRDYDGSIAPRSPCVDTEGRLYVATSLGIQVCDQAGRVNFIVPVPQGADDVCFGGKDLGELFIACGDKIYKRQMKVHGIVSGQMAPIKPPAPKL